MKLTAIFLLVGCLHVCADGFAQKVTMSKTNVPLRDVLMDISRQTGMTFSCKHETLEKAGKVSISVKDASLNQVLVTLFRSQPLVYSIQDNIIVITEKPIEKTALLDPRLTDVGIKGRVVNENEDPIAGVTVAVRGSSMATSTNGSGEFELTSADRNAVLVFSGANIETFELKVSGREDVLVRLKTKINKLDEVQVIAYGTTTQRFNPGNVSTVKAADIQKSPVNNALLAMQARVPGVMITQNSGIPGGGITVRLQGQNSLSRGSDPLYVVDGVPYISQLLPNISSTGTGILGTSGNTNTTVAVGGGNPLAFINPMDIESISVLKDADATAIYGSRAANGAILITTKKGKAGKTKVDLNVQSGGGRVGRKLDLMNTPQYLGMRRQAYYNDSLANPTGYVAPTVTTAPDLLYWDQNRYTDWQKVLIGGTAKYTDAQFSVSGGNASTQFLVGSGFHRETTVFPGDLADQKGSLHLNINHTSLNQRFKLQVDAKYLADNNQLITQDFTNYALRLPPNAPKLYNDDGSLNWAPLPNGNSSWINPLSFLQRTYSSKTNNLIGNATLGYQIIPGLELRTNLGYNNLQTNEISATPLTSYAPETRPNSLRIGYYGNSNIHSWNVEPQLEYKKRIWRGTFDGLLGSQIFHSYSDGQIVYGYGYNSDNVIKDILSAPNIGAVSSVSSQYKYAAMFARLNYNYDSRYVIDLTARRDGSSRFGISNQFHNFWSAAGAWLFSNEKFIAENVRFLSFGKLRASYGLTGNDQIGDYQFMSLYSPYAVTTAYQGAAGIAPNGLPNPNLQWEETKKLQFGLELGFLKDRILLNTSYYRNQSSNLLQSYALPVFTGNTGIQVNFPATVRNYGLELSLSTKNIDGENFGWTSYLNFTIPRNKLVDFPNLSTSTYASIYVVGQPITIRKVYNNVGVDPSTGLFQYVTGSGTTTSGTLNALTDRTILENIDPKLFGGLQNSFRYKGFQLDVLFQYVNQKSYNYLLGSQPGRFAFNLSTGSVNGNQPAYVLGAWGKSGETSSVQKYSATYPSAVNTPYSNASVSNLAYSDGSYIRLKNLSFSWQLPNKWKQRLRLDNARIYAQGQNLLTITNYKGLDPETPSVLNLPPLKVLTVGIQVGL